MAEDVKSEVVSEKAPAPVAEKKEAPAPKPAPAPASSDTGDWKEMGFASKRRYERFKRKFS